MKNDNKGRDIFYGIVAIATLIVAIIGATLAYFSVTASSNEGAVNAMAAVVSIEYNDGQQVTAQADELIPATPEVVESVYESKIKGKPANPNIKQNLCIDDNERQVCSAYRFTITSDIDRSITAILNNEQNGFTYLRYAIYDVTNGQWIKLSQKPKTPTSKITYESLYPCSNENESTDDDCYVESTSKIYSAKNKAINSIFGYKLDGDSITNQSVELKNEVQEYELVLFIEETGEIQNIDQGQSYHGNILVEVLDGGLSGSGNITGCVGPDCVK